MNQRRITNAQTTGRVGRRTILGCCLTIIMITALQLVSAQNGRAGLIAVPNNSFESPVVPPVSPYAGPDIDYWQKSPQPAWYDPTQNANTPWVDLMGEFYNVPFPGQFIDNCDGSQAAFLFALPDVALFQDYDSVYGTNTLPSHAFNAKFNVGSSYNLIVAALGGGGGMQAGATLQLSLYYRDASSNMVVVASTSITNTATLFPTNTHFLDFPVYLANVKASDPWAGQNIGIQLLSTASLALAGGYWDVDNVRLVETAAPGVILSELTVTNGQFTFAVQSPPGVQFDVEATSDISTNATWISLGTLTNANGFTSFTDPSTNMSRRYYRVRQL